MIGGNDKISNSQIVFILITTIVGVGILSLPSALVERVGSDGWISIIIGSILVSILVAIATILTSYYPGKTVIEFGREIVSTPVSDIISFLFIVYFVVISAFTVRIFAEVVKMFLLDKTPTEVIIMTMLFTVAYIVRGGIEGIGRMAEIILPVVILPLLLLFIAIIPDLDFTNLLPVFRTSFTDIVKTIPLTFFSFMGYELILFFMAYVDKPKNSTAKNIAAIVIVTLIYLIFFTVTLARFGQNEVRDLLWPSLSLVRSVDLPGFFIENVEAVVMGLWVLNVFASLSPVYYGAVLTLTKLLRANEHKYFVLPLLPFIYILSLVPDNLASVYTMMDMFIYYYTTIILIGVPILYFIISLFKKANKKGVGSNG
ncbi:GerAB/ArcD/ProY family transporter [Thermohalobacter berrensis]|uniref:Uncharacterized protein n=1 Tax=Thermohalobacter berrensis TaxID=99594 RepID=A0A419T0F6_9FIRM|nr:endospore germination permease [Thermohalobacter berrensis]RKD30919.1 hypothetical protein BET03_13145 [Thermohalobacter berrensis]